MTDAVKAAQHSAKVASVVGVVGLVWVGSSFAVSVASAYDVAWGVPSRATRARLVGLGWLAGGGVLLAVGSFVTAGLADAPGAGRAARARSLSLAVNTVLWLWTSWILPNRHAPPWRRLLPGAIFGRGRARGAEDRRRLRGAAAGGEVVGASTGPSASVFALLAWLWVLGRLVVLVTIVETLDRVTAGAGRPASPDLNARVHEPVVQPVVAVLPELDLVGHDAVPTPAVGTRHLAVGEARLELGDAAPRARRGSRSPRSAPTPTR